MKKLNSKGFTLVELLAVIIILAVIVAIAVPTVSDIIKSSKQSSLDDSASLIVKTAEQKAAIAALGGDYDLSDVATEIAALGAEYGYSSFTCTADSTAEGVCTITFTQVTSGSLKGFTATGESASNKAKYTFNNPTGVKYPAS